jgi:hypothetical protein
MTPPALTHRCWLFMFAQSVNRTAAVSISSCCQWRGASDMLAAAMLQYVGASNALHTTTGNQAQGIHEGHKGFAIGAGQHNCRAVPVCISHLPAFCGLAPWSVMQPCRSHTRTQRVAPAALTTCTLPADNHQQHSLIWPPRHVAANRHVAGRLQQDN